MRNSTITKSLVAIGLVLATAPIVFAAKPKDEDTHKVERTEVLLPQKKTPVKIEPTANTVYTFAGKEVNNMRGLTLAESGDYILDLAVNPGHINYVVVARDGKKNIVEVFNPSVENELIGRVKNKFGKTKYAEPLSVAYNPDARSFYVATDTVLRVFEYNKLQQIGTMPLKFGPSRMVVSPNGYFLACWAGPKLAVYNLEGKVLRKEWNTGSDISDVVFSKDNDQMAVLARDGVLTIYDTRNFMLRKSLEDVGDGLAADWNFDGKYMAIVTKPDTISVYNMVDEEEAPTLIAVPEGNSTDIAFIKDFSERPILVYNGNKILHAKRMAMFLPYYGKMVNEEAQAMLDEWMKMMPGESMEQYSLRVNDESRKAKLRDFEDQVATSLAGDLLSMADISLGKYDRTNEMLQVNFSNMPSIFLQVPEEDLLGIGAASDLRFTNARYGVMPNDHFELIYAEVLGQDGKTYTYNNVDRVPLKNISDNDDFVSIEIIREKQMETLKLMEIKEEVVAEAKKENVISDHTNITVDSRVEADYDADGNKITNYIVNFSYEVDPGFSVVEDFAPGKYHAEQSGAASSMLKVVKQAFEGDFARYLVEGKKLMVTISGTADATPIVGRIVYDGAYGAFENEPIMQNGQLAAITVMPKDLVQQNEQLAFLRAAGVKTFLHDNVENLNKMNADYRYNIDVAEDKGSEFRRITTEFKFYDIQ